MGRVISDLAPFLETVANGDLLVCHNMSKAVNTRDEKLTVEKLLTDALGNRSVTITSGGSVGIGTTSPGSQLTVVSPWTTANGNGTPLLSISGNSNGSSSFVGGANFSPTIGTLGTNNLTLTAVAVSPTFFANNSSITSNAYSLYLSATKTGTQTLTNAYSLYVNAPTGATNNYAAVFNGNVGIGTATPAANLDVVGGSNNPGIMIRASGFTGTGLENDLLIVGDNDHTNLFSNDVPPSLFVVNRRATGTSLARMGLSAGDGNVYGYFIADRSGVGTANNGLVSAGLGIVARSNHPLMFLTNNSERMRIAENGDVTVADLSGVGTSAIEATSAGLLQRAASDARMKTDVEEIGAADALAMVDALRPVRYRWGAEYAETRGEQVEVGLIAQEVQAHVPELVGANRDGMLSVDYARLTALLIGAVQALTARVEALEAAAA